MANLATITTNILADSGIDDINVVVSTGSYADPAWITSLAWTKITGTPTTLAGYGITDAVTTNTAQTITAEKIFTSWNLVLESNNTAQATVLRNSPGSQAVFIGRNTFGFNGSNNIYFNKGTQLNAGIFAFTNTEQRTYTLPDASGTIALVGGSGVGTVTSVAALTLGTSGTDLSSSVANSTTTPVITLNVPTASATNRGALSAADWTTFNNKQNALTNPVTGTGTTNFVPKFTGASTIGNSLVFDNGSSVGINTITPSLQGFNNELTISSGTSGTRRAALNLQGSRTVSSTFASIGFYHQANFVASIESSRGGADNSGNLQFFTTNAGVTGERMTIDPSGNLGLGVTPSAWGSLNTSLDFTYGSLYRFSNTSFGIAGNAFYNGSNWIYKLSQAASDYFLESGQHIWRTAPSGTAGNAISWTQAMTLGSNSGLSIGTPSAAPSQGLLVQGNVGIGINPASKLDVLGEIRSTSTSGYAALLSISALGYSILADTHVGGAMTIWTAGSEKMRVFSDGNVGINTGSTNAGFKLDVNGTGRFSGALLVSNNDITQTGTRPILSLQQSGTTKAFWGISDGVDDLVNGASSGDAVFRKPASSGAFRWTVDGGSTSALVIASTGAATFSSSVTTGGGIQTNISKSGSGIENVNFLQLRLFGTNAIGDSLDIRYLNSAGNNIANISAILGGDNVAYGSLAFSTRNYFTDSMVEVMRINNRGNVGIATDSPTQGRLVVVADSSAITLALRARTGDDFSQVNFLNNAGNNLNGIIGVQKVGTNGGSMYFYTKPDGGSVSEAMRITSSGRVLIGTPPPAESTFQLDVNGTGRFSSTAFTNLSVDGTNSSGWGNNIAFRSQGTDFGYLGSLGSLLGSTTKDMTIWATAGNGFRVYTNGNNQRLEIASTGAATFSSSVTATAGIFNLNTTDGGFKIVGVNATPPNLAYLANNYFPKFYTRNHNFGITIFDQDSNNVGIQAADLVNGTSAKALIFNPYGGNVGIGTDSPTSSAGWTPTLVLNATDTALVVKGVNGQENTFGTANGLYIDCLGNSTGTNNNIIFRSTSVNSSFSAFERMRITSGGNVLIGTTTTPTPVSGVAFPLTVSSSAATRIRIDSTNASPNSGVGLYANGVQKFSFAMYGTDSDFTIYNDALLAPALTVKGTNSNVLIGTTTDVGAKLYVDGAFRTGTLTAGTQTAAVDWRLGNARGGAATNNALIRVQINGVLVDLLGNYV